MNLQRFCLKFFVTPESQFEQEALMPIFHRWIQTQALPYLLIDVADYKHVPMGPGMMLIAHEVNIGLDEAGAKCGLLIQQKQDQPGALRTRVEALVNNALLICNKLTQEPALQGKLMFDTNKFHFIVNDRLLAPNEPATAEVLKTELVGLAGYKNVLKLDNAATERLTLVFSR